MRRFLGSFFGLGLVPWAPGTFGTLGGVLLVWLLPGDLPLFLAAAVTFGIGVVLANGLRTKDPGWFVVDEVAAYMLVPLGLGRDGWVLAVAFVLFRIFDIAKPPPTKRLEFIPGGWGVMLDDLMAAAYAHAVLRLIVWFA
ncbi:MAG: phosphatidylglycerophosphatase A family protein [Planctomycetota bacterium]